MFMISIHKYKQKIHKMKRKFHAFCLKMTHCRASPLVWQTQKIYL